MFPNAVPKTVFHYNNLPLNVKFINFFNSINAILYCSVLKAMQKLKLIKVKIVINFMLIRNFIIWKTTINCTQIILNP